MPASEYVLLAKQPMYDMDKNCHAFELLFRTPMGSSAIDFGGEIATSQVLVNYCSSISQESETSSKPIFINVDSQFLLEHDSLPVSPENLVIDLNVDGDISSELLEEVVSWRTLGFVFALNSYDFDKKWQTLLPLMSYIKVDMLALDQDLVAHEMSVLNRASCHWVATRVENEEMFEFCQNIGFDFIQGHFLAKPKQILGNSIRPGTAVTTKLLKELDRQDITMLQIADLVSQDPKLTVQMLKIINSSLFSLPKPVDNLHSALVYLGVDMLRQWAMMIAFLSNGNVHIEACRLVLLRAKTCELVCSQKYHQTEASSSAFLVGLVSGVDVLLKVSAKDFLAQVRLSDVVIEAILENKGMLGEILNSVNLLEYSLAQAPEKIDDIPKSLLSIYQEANKWVEEVLVTLKR